MREGRRNPRLQKVVIHSPDRVGIVFKLRDGVVTCNAPDLEARFNETGLIGLDGCKYYPRDGKLFLEAVYDHYFLKGADIESTDRIITGRTNP